MMRIFIIQVHDPVIHLEVEEEQWEITQVLSDRPKIDERNGKRLFVRMGFAKFQLTAWAWTWTMYGWCGVGSLVKECFSLKNTLSVCVCCVFFPFILWTSSSLDVPAGVTQEEGHTGFLIHLLSAVRALIFLARRIQPFLSLVDREVEFCVLTI